jgi:cytochrome c peroxidase
MVQVQPNSNELTELIRDYLQPMGYEVALLHTGEQRHPQSKCPIRFCILLCAWLLLQVPGVSANMRVNVAAPAFDSLQYRTPSGQTYSLTRLDFILSELALQKADGTWLGLTDWFAYLSLREARDGFTLKGISAGKYQALRFNIGLRPETNRADVTKYPPTHPLNPITNTLWWGWQSGFVFMAIEGSWRRENGSLSGFSFHVATDKHLMSVQLAADLDLSTDTQLNLKLDASAILQGITLSDEASSTHSREEDTLADQLHRNIEQAFSIASISKFAPSDESIRATVVLDPKETLLPFTFTAHFPRPNLPGDNPLTVESVALGKQLFHDKRLSINGTQSCADCHDEAHAFTDPRQFSIGAEGQIGTRNAMPLFNLAWKQRFFWDGRSPSLRDQVLCPIQDPTEMHETLPNVEKKLGISADRISRALEQYLHTLVSDDAKIDRVMRGQEKFTEEEQHGFTLFHTEYDPRHGLQGADCFHCHGGILFQSVPFANNGLALQSKDKGLSATTKKPGDRGKFAVPSLRNVQLTAPYMHDGRFTTLAQVIDHYDHGLSRTDTLDPNLAKHPTTGLGLSAGDKAALVAFMKTLTDKRFGATRE